MVTTKKAFENLVVTLFNSFDSYSLPKSIVKAKPAVTPATPVALLLKHGPSKNQVALVLPDDGSEASLKIKNLIEKAKIKFESAKIHNKWPGLVFPSSTLPKIKTLLKDYSISQYQSKDFEKTAPVAKKSFKRSSKVSDQREDIIKRAPKPTLTLVENKWGNLSLGTLVFYEFEVDGDTRVLCIGTQNTKAKVNLAQPWASVVPLSDAAGKKIKAIEKEKGMKVDVLNEGTFEELINDEQRDALIKRGLIDFGEAEDEESDENTLEVEEEDGYALSSDEEDSEEDSEEDEDEEVEDDSEEDLEEEESEEEEDFGSSEDESEDDSDDYNTADEEEGSIEDPDEDE